MLCKHIYKRLKHTINRHLNYMVPVTLYIALLPRMKFPRVAPFHYLKPKLILLQIPLPVHKSIRFWLDGNVIPVCSL